MMALTLLSLVVLLAGLQETFGATVNTTHKYATEGRHPVEITCSYVLDDGESLLYLYIDTYNEGDGFVDIALFYPDNGTAFYSDDGLLLENRSTLVIRNGSVGLRFDVVECGDTGEYYCNIQTNVSYSYEWMQFFVSGTTSKPKLLVTRSECLDRNEDLELACIGKFAYPSGSFVWYGYHSDRATVNLTELADPGVPYRGAECSYKRTSHLKLNLKLQDQGLVIRCASSEKEAGIVPSSEDTCDEHCDESLPVSFSEPPAKPVLSMKRTSNCQVETVQFHCSGVVGSHEGHFLWFAYRPGQAPQALTATKKSTVPVKAHGSCGYQRESTLKLDLTKADNGLVIRCTIHSSFTVRSPTADNPCGEHCVQSEKLSVTDKSRCHAVISGVTSGVSEISSSVAWLLVTILFNAF